MRDSFFLSVGEAVVEAGELDIVVVRGALLCKLEVSGCLTHLDTQGSRLARRAFAASGLSGGGRGTTSARHAATAPR